MEFIFITTLLIQLFIAAASRNEDTRLIPVKKHGKLFIKSSVFLYRKFLKRMLINSGSYIKIDKYITNLHPGKSREHIITVYYLDKIRLSYSLILIGNILALLVSLSISQKSILNEELIIPKNTWEQGSYILDLSVAAKDSPKEANEIKLVVEPVSLSEKEAFALAQEVFYKLQSEILASNHSLSEVMSSLNLVTKLNNYPFSISWETDKPLLIRADGRIDNRELIAESGEVVKLTAHLLYQDLWTNYRFSDDIYICLLPYTEGGLSGWAEAVKTAVMDNQQKRAFNDFFYLPAEIGGSAVSWQEKLPPDGLYLWLIVLAAAFIAFAGQDRDLQKKVTIRNRQIDRDYPEMVRKLTLYLSAGMTLRGAFKRLSSDYSKTLNYTLSGSTKKEANKVKYLYEEMLFSVREMENGIPEREAYERFGKRLGIAKYRKLCGLLCNHLQKGNNNLLMVLREETELALEGRKKKARAIGEEMSTKLLFPMMLMLLIVMVIIMVPAFQMF